MKNKYVWIPTLIIFMIGVILLVVGICLGAEVSTFWETFLQNLKEGYHEIVHTLKLILTETN